MALADMKVKISIEGAEAAKSALEGVHQGILKVAGAAGSVLKSSLSAAGNELRNLATIAASVTLAMEGMAAVVGIQTAVKLDSLTRGLASVSVNAADLQGQMARLREVAKLPSLGFEEAVQGSLRLQAAGLNANLAERALASFGNAIATVGGGKEQLDGVTLALGQIAAKGKVSAEEINQLNERIPQIRKAMQAAFGTSDTEALAKLGIDADRFIGGVVAQFEKLPKVTGGAQDSIENLGDSLKTAFVPLGQGFLQALQSLTPFLENVIGKIGDIARRVGEVIAALGASGVVQDVFGKLEKSFGDLFGPSMQERIIGFVATVASVIGNLPATVHAVMNNIGVAFQTAKTEIMAVFVQITSAVSSLLSALDSAQNLRFGEAFKTLSNAGDVASAMGGAVRATNPTGSFVDIPDPMKDAGRYADMIKGALKPLQGSQGLNFGGGGDIQSQAQSASSSIWAQWDKYLAGIEKNTQRTANILDSRRSIGGGDLARAGVSGAEMARVNDARYRRLYGRG